MPLKTTCKIVNINQLSEDILSFDIQSTGNSFSNLEAGAHVDIYLDSGLIKQYSIWDWSEDCQQVSIAVKREPLGAGGSIEMHQLKVNDLINLSEPKNNFKIKKTGSHYCLIAGGIGITPIYSMANYLKSIDVNFEIYYLVQNDSQAAFNQQLNHLNLGEKYQLHCDNKKGLFDFTKLINSLPIDSEIYCCGPEPMLNAVKNARSNLNMNNKINIHYELFSKLNNIQDFTNTSFAVKVNSTGAILQVNEHESILDVLSKNGIQIPYACSNGICGTCITDVLEGDIDHRDEILSQEDKDTNEFMCVCVSRARSKLITLDL